jgi:carboxylesterase type B
MSSNCSKSSDCYCSLFYNYSRLISDVLFFNDYYRFLTQHIQYSNRTYLYQYSYRTSIEHPTPCNDYLYKNNLVGHFAELEYTWGTPLLFENKNSSNNLIPLIKYSPYLSNTTSTYTNEQIEFSQQIIEQWTNFINYGQPNSTKFQNQWIPIHNISNGYIMNLKLNQSHMKQFQIPSNIQFWKNTCLTVGDNTSIDVNNQLLTYEISLFVLLYLLCMN